MRHIDRRKPLTHYPPVLTGRTFRGIYLSVYVGFIYAAMPGIPGFPSRVYFLSDSHPGCLAGLSGFPGTRCTALFIHPALLMLLFHFVSIICGHQLKA